MMIPVSLSPEMNSPVIQDDITSCTASSSSSESEDEKAAATKVCKDTENILQSCAWCEYAIHEQAHLICIFCFRGPGVSGATFCKYARCNFIIRTLYIVPCLCLRYYFSVSKVFFGFKMLTLTVCACCECDIHEQARLICIFFVFADPVSREPHFANMCVAIS